MNINYKGVLPPILPLPYKGNLFFSLLSPTSGFLRFKDRQITGFPHKEAATHKKMNGKDEHQLFPSS